MRFFVYCTKNGPVSALLKGEKIEKTGSEPKFSPGFSFISYKDTEDHTTEIRNPIAKNTRPTTMRGR